MHLTFRQTVVNILYTKLAAFLLILYAKCLQNFVGTWYTHCIHFVYISCIHLVQFLYTKYIHSFKMYAQLLFGIE